MMTEEQYYTPPPEDVFEDIKHASIKLWETYDDTYGYATEKIERIKDIKNVRDNAWYMVAMFDVVNQQKLLTMVHPLTREKIEEVLDWKDDEISNLRNNNDRQ